MAGGIKLSLLVAICVSFINFIIGAVYGAIEGYYGGLTDLIMERISDILCRRALHRRGHTVPDSPGRQGWARCLACCLPLC